MTDRHAGYIVTLENPLRDDDARTVLEAIKTLRHVVSVEPIVADVTYHTAKQSARHELTMKLWQALEGK